MKPTGAKLPSQADIARMIGVDQSTVSYALRGSPNISPQTRARVLRLVAQLNYRPNAHAQSLRKGESDLVGVVISPLHNLFQAQLAERIWAELRNVGFQMMVRQSVNAKEEQRKQMLELLDRRAVGVIIETTHPELAHEIPRIIGRAIPFVVIGPEIAGSASVSCDRHRAGAMMADHLLSLGRRRPAVFWGSPSPADRGPKVEGFCAAMEAAGVATVDLLIPDRLSRQVAAAVSPVAAADVGYQVAAVLRDEHPEVDSVFCVSDELAMGLVSGLRDLGIDVPGQIAVGGFDDVPLARHAAVPLTTIRQPIADYARIAVGMLLEQIGSATKKAAKRARCLDCELVVRRSTDSNWRPAAPSL